MNGNSYWTKKEKRDMQNNHLECPFSCMDEPMDSSSYHSEKVPVSKSVFSRNEGITLATRYGENKGLYPISEKAPISSLCHLGKTSNGNMQRAKNFSDTLNPKHNNKDYSLSKEEEVFVLHQPIEQCYNPPIKKEDKEMSFVGILQNSNGMVAFADEKSVYCIGNISYPKGYSKKAYKGKNFLMVTYGNNQISANFGIVPLQNVIEKVNPEKYSDYDNFLNALWKEINRLGGFLFDKSYFFIVGYKNDYSYDGQKFSNYMIKDIEMNSGGCYALKQNLNAAYNGYSDLLPGKIEVREDWTLDEMKDFAYHLVDYSIYCTKMLYKENAMIAGKPQILTLV